MCDKKASHESSVFQLTNTLLKPLVLLLQAATLHLDLICVANGMVYQVKAKVGSITILLYDSDILTQGLMGVFELTLQPLLALLVHDLRVGLLEGNLSPQVLHLTVSIRLDPRDLLLLALTPDLVEITKQCVHKCFRDVDSTTIAEVMSDAVSLVRNPLVTVLFAETLFRVG